MEEVLTFSVAEQRQKWLVVSACPNPKFGDYQCNSAMAIHKFLKDQVSTSLSASPGWISPLPPSLAPHAVGPCRVEA